MSHFSVMVRVPASVPLEDVEDAVDGLLAPYHQFECTGRDDEFVKDIDITEDCRASFAASSRTKVRTPAGELVCAFDDRFYRDPTEEEIASIGPIGGTGCGNGMSWTSRDWDDGRGYRTKVRYLPEGHAKVEVKTSEIETFAAWLTDEGKDPVAFGEKPDLAQKHKYGYSLLDANGEVVKVIDRTNPRKKWDWWSIGGRWTGKLTGYDPAKDMANYKACWICKSTGTRADTTYGEDQKWARQPTAAGHPVIGRGCNACFGTGWEMKFPTDLQCVGNIIRIAQIDFNRVEEATDAKLKAFWDEWQEFIAGKDFPHFEGPRTQALSLGLIDCKDISDLNGSEWKVIPWDKPDCPEGKRNRCDVLKPTTLEWLKENRRDNFCSLSTWARLDANGWVEKGEMMMFACSDATPESERDHAKGLMPWLKSGDQEDWAVIVDCHI